MDRIFINGLRVNALIGCYPAERERRQGITLDLELGVDLSAAAVSDELSDTVNYAELEERIHSLVSGSRFKLIEALAGAVGRLALEYERIRFVRVRVDKPRAAKYARSIAVELEFHKE
ncbi:dihydroneopterin aldolase [uncultured Victivallis sp.]|uniref:dihydroneopterin aldolase n=1 Tax=uncultured Victivallis sp. TaxID=354118 RepID=UPI0025F10B11|nr:dihydroneopterin aldolase [uncultured Victivallis sp.]